MPSPLPPGRTVLGGNITTAPRLTGAVAITPTSGIRTFRSGTNTLSLLLLSNDPPALQPAPNPPQATLDIYAPDYPSTLPVVLPGPFVLLDQPVSAGQLLIGGVDYTAEHIRSGSQSGLRQASQGTIELVRVGRTLDPAFNSDFEVGTRVSLKVTALGVEQTVFENFFIVEQPRFVPEGTGERLTLVVGDDWIDARRAKTTQDAPDCTTPPPTTTGEVATQMMKRAGKNIAFPRGVGLSERFNNIEREDRLAAASALMAPSGQVIYTTPQNITVVTRWPRFDRDSATDLFVEDLLEAPIISYNGTVGYGTVQMRNNTFRELPLVSRKLPQDTVPIQGFNANDFTPWFLGGRNQFDVVDRVTFGGETDFEQKIHFGRYPIASSVPVDEARDASNASRCGVNNTDTTGATWTAANTAFGPVYTFLYRRGREPHCSGKWLINEIAQNTTGFTWINTGNTWERYPSTGSSPLSQELEEFNNVEYPDDRVCKCDYSWLLRDRTRRRWRVTDINGGMRVVEIDRESWRLARSDEALALGEAVGAASGWRRITSGEDYDEETGELVPRNQVLSFELPPDAMWIPLPREEIKFPNVRFRQSAVVAQVGEGVSDPLEAPYCWTTTHFRDWGELWLRSHNARFREVSVSLSPTKILNIGEGIKYWNRERSGWIPLVVTDKDAVLENGGLTYAYTLGRGFP